MIKTFLGYGTRDINRRSCKIRVIQRALEDLNPRHQVLETCVLPTELRAHMLNDSDCVLYLVYQVLCIPVEKTRERQLGERTIETLLQAGCLAHAIAEIVQLCPTHFRPTQDLDTFNARRVNEENSLNSDTLENSADSNALRDASATLCDYNAFIRLRPFFIALLNDHADANRIPNVNGWEIVFHLFRFDRADDFLRVHKGFKTHNRVS
jgi:hypothetical protein